MNFDANTIIYLLEIIVGGLLVGIGVHFVPVGGAPAAMAQATGIGTGTVQLAAGSGLTGLLSAGLMMYAMTLSPTFAQDGYSIWPILLTGAVGAMIMMDATMLTGSWIYAYAVGAPFASAKVNYDPITKFSQPPYVAPGTVGQGIPTVCFVSGTIGAAMGGLGGAMIYFPLVQINGNPAMSAIFAIGIFMVDAVLASWNIQGTIEGFHDPKFKKWPKAFKACLVSTAILAVVAILITPLVGGA
ncbi:MAG: tetrahydromethanopterin S-methyltransferase subunit D [Methanothrix sp.]|jgi:tetrahydromethanopterin S-methyltransferase subunit D|nr:tetrahydromethanopterin S-methyltransferase subunit D [Methanothrix sp.]MDD1741676.1 tetrahydromethanopterin S-methyltransferase subunit D [Methanothrix sp.]OYV09040.1 MAG: tetrahydromethanopterin S-methyltransferase subunit D [Methanosaeta sp. NSP1]